MPDGGVPVNDTDAATDAGPLRIPAAGCVMQTVAVYEPATGPLVWHAAAFARPGDARIATTPAAMTSARFAVPLGGRDSIEVPSFDPHERKHRDFERCSRVL